MTRRPDILPVPTDQHRLSAAGACGPTPRRTPHIDRLACEGVLFRNACTACPVCTPARASIMTGQAPHNHGMTLNGVLAGVRGLWAADAWRTITCPA